LAPKKTGGTVRNKNNNNIIKADSDEDNNED
jgi:hypothetical protein